MALSCSKKLSAFLRGITSKHQRGFYCLNCLHSFTTKNKLESHKNLCEYKKFSRDGFFFFFLLFFFELGLKDAGFHFRKYKKSFVLRKYKIFLNIKATRKFHFLKYKEFFGGCGFLFFELKLKSATGSPTIYY